MRFAAALLLSMFTALPLAAQYAERLDVWVANVDVIVTDRDGNPVRGLTKDDFEVLEDGVAQPITNFSAIESATSGPAKGAVAPRADEERSGESAGRRRLVILFVDISEIEPASRQRFFGGVRAFLDASLRENDFFTVLSWNHRIRVAVAPTSNRDATAPVLKALAAPYGRRDEVMAAEIRDVQAELQSADAELARALGIAMLDDPEADAAFREWLRQEEICAESKRKIRELRNLFASLSRVDMQKVLIMASDNAPLSAGANCQLRETWNDLADTANAYGITINAFHPPGPRDPMIGPQRGRFLPGPGDPAPGHGNYTRAWEESGGLTTVAQRTGGIAGIGPADSQAKLEQVARELESYYSIGYRMTSGNEDKPRSLRIATKNRAYRVRTRQSVVRPSETTRLRDTVVTNLYLREPSPSKSPLFSATVPRVTGDGRYRMAHLEVRVPARELALLDAGEGTRKGSFSMFVAAGREFGDASDVSELRQDFAIGPDADEGREIVYTFGVKIRPDTRRLSLAMRDNTTGEVATKIVELQPAERAAGGR